MNNKEYDGSPPPTKYTVGTRLWDSKTHWEDPVANPDNGLLWVVLCA